MSLGGGGCCGLYLFYVNKKKTHGEKFFFQADPEAHISLLSQHLPYLKIQMTPEVILIQ